ncbi:ABC transporter ATP-binding protein [Pseudonocardia sulfidoxydans NBRC 16205]|uniref:ABC transporter ATP-binding protein n=1 Tax=Pseudonocardia sulfidoxydans NBRC 16205 TaxID=1223511 RepID=A0A511DBY1_9PSEU|nr:ABC transporter ATP-binding protein [Pseudonocardia sulfidoxydans]GEL22291.1 ABC transporter ATP-binding protein [Pseudonocardia sulfidoxydans NBRC 16205]
MSEVRIDRLAKLFDSGGVRAVDDLSLTLAEGQLVVLLGPSGCGKTTLLRCVAGLETPNSGTIEIGGALMFGRGGRTQVPTHRRGIGMVFQNYALWPHMTVEQNVAYPLRVRGTARHERSRQAREALALVECEALADRVPSAISGGQQQRVALARALVARPGLMLFDEPLSNLDYRLRAQLRQQLRELHRTLGFTGLYVTHDQTEAMQLGTVVAVLKDGKVEQLAEPASLFSRPASAYVARFLGIGNRLELARDPGGLWAVGGGDVRIGLPAAGDLPGDRFDLYLRSTDVSLAVPGSGPDDADVGRVPGVVTDVVYSGESSEWVVQVGEARIVAAARTGVWPFGSGDRVEAVFRHSTALLYESGEQGRLVESYGVRPSLVS